MAPSSWTRSRDQLTACSTKDGIDEWALTKMWSHSVSFGLSSLVSLLFAELAWSLTGVGGGFVWKLWSLRFQFSTGVLPMSRRPLQSGATTESREQRGRFAITASEFSVLLSLCKSSAKNYFVKSVLCFSVFLCFGSTPTREVPICWKRREAVCTEVL